jgi:hypothetical protein
MRTMRFRTDESCFCFSMNNLSHIIVSSKGNEASIADDDREGPQPTDEQILLSEAEEEEYECQFFFEGEFSSALQWVHRPRPAQ